MKPFTQTADTLDQELADKIDGILAAHGEDPTQLVGILLDVEAAVERHYIPEAAAYYVAERLGVKPTQAERAILRARRWAVASSGACPAWPFR